MTFDELIQLHQSHLQGLRRHHSTTYNHLYVQRVFSQYCLDNFKLTDPRGLESQHMVAYFAHLRSLALSRHVKYSRQRLLKTWLAWATYQGHIFIDPCKDFVLSCPPSFPRTVPTESQIVALMDATDGTRIGRRDRVLMEFLYGTGLRIGECVAVDIPDLDLEARQVFVRKGKGNRQRRLPLGPKLTQLLKDYIQNIRPLFAKHQEQDCLWISRRGSRLGVVHANGRIHEWATLAGIPASAHSFRHAFATHLLARGVPIVIIQRLMGHATMGMTARYTHLLPIDVQKALQDHHPRAKRKRRRAERPKDDGAGDEGELYPGS